MSSITARYETRPLKTIRDIFDLDTLRIGIPKATVYSEVVRTGEHQIYTEMRNFKLSGRLEEMPYFTLPEKEILDQVADGSLVLFTHIYDIFEIMEIDYDRNKICRLYTSEEPFFEMPESLAVRKGSPLVGVMNQRYVGLR